VGTIKVSKVIKGALEDGVVQAADPEHPRAGYLPYWA